MNAAQVSLRARPPVQSMRRAAIKQGLETTTKGVRGEDRASLLGVSKSTVSNILLENHDPSFEALTNAAFHTQCEFIQPWLASLGYRAVPLEATSDSDAGMRPIAARFSCKLVEALDDNDFSRGEAIDMLADCEAMQGVIDRVRKIAAVTG